MNDPLILIGRLGGAHGVRGEVKLLSFTQEPSAIASYRPLLTKDRVPLEIVRLRPVRIGFVAQLRHVTDREQAQALNGTELFTMRSSLPMLAEGEAYHYDLVGLEVRCRGIAQMVGKIVAVVNYGAGDLLEIDWFDQKETVLVPYAPAFIGELDWENRTITLELPIDYN